MADRSLRVSTPDGYGLYRTDATDRGIGILPQSCNRRKHRLSEVGYRATERDGLAAGQPLDQVAFRVRYQPRHPLPPPGPELTT